jgi:putative sigma-54 modulation protein
MHVVVTFRHVEGSDALRRYAETKVERLRKFLRRPIEAHVVLSVVKRRHVADVTLSADHATLHAAEQTGDLYSAIDLAIDKLDRQVQKLVKKRQARKHAGAERPAPPPPPRLPRVRRERVAVEPMSLREAIERLGGDERNLLVFHDLGSDLLSILYRRKDGSYGLIEPEVA